MLGPEDRPLSKNGHPEKEDFQDRKSIHGEGHRFRLEYRISGGQFIIGFSGSVTTQEGKGEKSLQNVFTTHCSFPTTNFF